MLALAQTPINIGMAAEWYTTFFHNNLFFYWTNRYALITSNTFILIYDRIIKALFILAQYNCFLGAN